MVDDILICPKTRSRLRIDAANCVARVEGSSLSYPIKDGIIDFFQILKTKYRRRMIRVLALMIIICISLAWVGSCLVRPFSSSCGAA